MPIIYTYSYGFGATEKNNSSPLCCFAFSKKNMVKIYNFEKKKNSCKYGTIFRISTHQVKVGLPLALKSFSKRKL